MDYPSVKTYILQRLESELSPDLTYHGIHHTLDVLEAAIRIAESEQISAEDLLLVKTAALFHDAGFVKNHHKEHEEESCQLVKACLPKYGYSSETIATICGMIRATKIPQSPQNKLEQILCDADLDYLGRSDFYTISNSLFEELRNYNQLSDVKVWNKLQVSFIGAHSYFTETNKKEREPKKCEFLDELIQIIEQY